MSKHLDPLKHQIAIQTKAKPWGKEIWFAHTEDYAGKLLHISAGHRYSLQYHEQKTETQFLISGQVKFTFGKDEQNLQEIILNPGDKFDVYPYTVHRAEGLIDSVILEVSTNHLDDVVRLSDDYNRTN